MAKTSIAPSDLVKTIKALQAERQRHVDAIAQIDATFKQYGISAQPRRRRGRPKGSGGKKTAKKGRKKKVAKKKTRGSYKQTADQLILSMLKGSKTLTTADINTRWKQARRGGKPDNTLTKLVKDKKLKREKIEGAKGSKYSLA